MKQIIHISSASCLRLEFSLVTHPCRQGKHFVSSLIPPHRWPHFKTLRHPFCACNWNKKNITILKRAGSWEKNAKVYQFDEKTHRSKHTFFFNNYENLIWLEYPCHFCIPDIRRLHTHFLWQAIRRCWPYRNTDKFRPEQVVRWFALPARTNRSSLTWYHGTQQALVMWLCPPRRATKTISSVRTLRANPLWWILLLPCTPTHSKSR